MAVAFGAVVAEPAQHIDTHLFGAPVNGMIFECLQQFRARHRPAFVADRRVPSLVIDAGANDFNQIAIPASAIPDQVRIALKFRFVAVEQRQRGGNLIPAALNAVAEADKVNLAVINRRPGIHRHRIGIIQE